MCFKAFKSLIFSHLRHGLQFAPQPITPLRLASSLPPQAAQLLPHPRRQLLRPIHVDRAARHLQDRRRSLKGTLFPLLNPSILACKPLNCMKRGTKCSKTSPTSADGRKSFKRAWPVERWKSLPHLLGGLTLYQGTSAAEEGGLRRW